MMRFLRPSRRRRRKQRLVVVRDGPLHLVPFDGFIDNAGRYVAETHTVIYEPSATSFYLLTSQKHRPTSSAHALLAVGGVPYSPAELKQASITRGYDAGALSDLPASKDEVIAAEAALHGPGNLLLIGPRATESAFKTRCHVAIRHHSPRGARLCQHNGAKSFGLGLIERSGRGRRRFSSGF